MEDYYEKSINLYLGAQICLSAGLFVAGHQCGSGYALAPAHPSDCGRRDPGRKNGNPHPPAGGNPAGGPGPVRFSVHKGIYLRHGRL